jgi:PAS domain S-box-containing protein
VNRLALSLGIALLVVELSAALALIATNGQSDRAWATVALEGVTGAAFVVAGLIALARRPENRTGIYLAATGYVWYFGALTELTNEWLFSIGFLLSDLIWVSFTALVLAYPTGRFESRLDRSLPLVAGALLLATSTCKLLFDPTPAPDRCDECPGSPIVVADRPAVADTVDVATSVVGLALIVLVVVLLARRWRRATPAARRVLWPVVGAGAATFLTVALVIVADQVSESAAELLQVLLFVTFSAVPFAFLFGILRTRLARSAVSDLVVELDRGAPIREALAGALGDPSLEIVYPLDSGWVDELGHDAEPIVARPGAALAPVESEGKVVAALVHDASLSEDPALLDGVAHAASLALHTQGLQAEARAQFAFLRTLVETAPSLFIHLGTDGRVRNQNAAAVEAAGLDDEELVRGRHFWDVFIDPEEREDVIARFHALAPDFETGEYENAFVNARGERRVVFWRSAPVQNEAGKVTGIISGGIDITERRRRELELERERDATTTALESIPSIVLVVDRAGRIRDRDIDNPRVGANRAFRQALGWRDEQLVDHPFLDFVVDDSDGRAAGALATAAAGSASEEVESELRCADGSLRAFAWSAVPVADVTGRTEALVLVSGVEVTERRRLEAEKERERAFLNAIANNAPSLLCLIDREGRLTHMGANMAFEQTLGYASEEIAGQVFWEQFVHPDDAPLVERLIGRAAAGHVVGENDSRWVTSGGTQLVVAWTCTPLPRLDERTLFLITGVDVTERNELTEELRASRARIVRAEDEARRVLERNLHDGAQQRLVAISVALRLIESKLQDEPAAAAALLDGTREELAQALEELRELARGIHPAVLTDRGLAPAVEALVSRAPVPVDVDISSDRLPEAVEAASYYVVAEALTNVAKYSGATEARVQVAREDGRVVVSVHDDGAGGADPSRGSGLRGLADRVGALDGVLVVESPVGQGTTVRAEIPVSNPTRE